MRRKYEPEILDSFEHLRRKQQRVKRPEVVQYSSELKVQVACNEVGVLFMFFYGCTFLANCKRTISVICFAIVFDFTRKASFQGVNRNPIIENCTSFALYRNRIVPKGCYLKFEEKYGIGLPYFCI